jgi:DNA-directed RNA polymerase specialized sigma24 family protein
VKARSRGTTAGSDAPAAHNDNATGLAVSDTTGLAAHRDLVRYLRPTLRRYGVAPQNMADAIAEVQADSIEAARKGRMPADLAQWKAFATKIAVRRAVDRLREAEVRDKYDVGLCDDADAYARPTLHWAHADPVDTKRQLAVLKELFDAGQMPERGAEILWGEAEQVPHAEIAAEIGVTTTVVDNRLSGMRARFRARLAALGILTLLLLLLAVLHARSGEVAGPAPRTKPPAPRGLPRFAP